MGRRGRYPEGVMLLTEVYVEPTEPEVNADTGSVRGASKWGRFMSFLGSNWISATVMTAASILGYLFSFDVGAVATGITVIVTAICGAVMYICKNLVPVVAEAMERMENTKRSQAEAMIDDLKAEIVSLKNLIEEKTSHENFLREQISNLTRSIASNSVYVKEMTSAIQNQKS